jgi:hypothetical protein
MNGSTAARPSEQLHHTPERILAPAGMAGHPPAGRAAAGRLPHPVLRLAERISPTSASTSREDDIRHIDWNVTARMDTPYVRQYVEDARYYRLVPAGSQPVHGLWSSGAAEANWSSIDFVATLARLLVRGTATGSAPSCTTIA